MSADTPPPACPIVLPLSKSLPSTPCPSLSLLTAHQGAPVSDSSGHTGSSCSTSAASSGSASAGSPALQKKDHDFGTGSAGVLQSISAAGKLMWTSMCSAWSAATNSPLAAYGIPISAPLTNWWRWWWMQDSDSASPHSSNPPQYPGFQYGFLRGTFGLPYGGYLVQPPHGALRNALVLSESMNMFSVLGTQREIIEFLRHMRTMIFCKVPSRSFTSEIVVEMYPRPAQHPLSSWCSTIPFLGRWVDIVFSRQRQLVIRAGRSFTPSDFKPLLRIHAPQGLMLCEIAAIVESSASTPRSAYKNGCVDLTRDKALNIKVMGRSRSASLLDLDSDRAWSPFSHDDDDYDYDSCLLPPYRRSEVPRANSASLPPPAYSL
ncbi:hypothetical protein BX070DRAFT_236971 [Coemansia spiralis]|nr:hypothetical protein BX070DRAFT_236971 [Coemansia spiralis]